MNLTPLGDRVIVSVKSAEETTKGGIILPDTAKEKPQQGTILAVGPGRLLDDGSLTPVEVKKGDEVLYGKYAGTSVKIDGEEVMILRESDILAIIE